METAAHQGRRSPPAHVVLSVPYRSRGCTVEQQACRVTFENAQPFWRPACCLEGVAGSSWDSALDGRLRGLLLCDWLPVKESELASGFGGLFLCLRLGPLASSGIAFSCSLLDVCLRSGAIGCAYHVGGTNATLLHSKHSCLGASS